jgi:hypothetical protein
MKLFAFAALWFDSETASGNANSNCSSAAFFTDNGIVFPAGMFAARFSFNRI